MWWAEMSFAEVTKRNQSFTEMACAWLGSCFSARTVIDDWLFKIGVRSDRWKFITRRRTSRSRPHSSANHYSQKLLTPCCRIKAPKSAKSEWWKTESFQCHVFAMYIACARILCLSRDVNSHAWMSSAELRISMHCTHASVLPGEKLAEWRLSFA